MRIGHGYDVHRLVEDRPLILGGVTIAYEKGLLGHSDADVLTHAVMDALLSGAGLNDIGHYFPDTDERWKNADSIKMLERVLSFLQERGYAVKNVSVAIQAEKPRLKNYIERMKQRLSSVIGVDINAVGITAGTNEKLGYVGEGKGITVYATALLKEVL